MFKNYPPITLSSQQIADKIDSLDSVSLLTNEQASAIEEIQTEAEIQQIVDTRVGSLAVGDLSREVITVGLSLIHI